MTAWGVTPAQGRRCYCGTCGAVIAFIHEVRIRSAVDAEKDRVTLAIEGHFRSSARCRSGGTFEGETVPACRCETPLRLPRVDGLFCARCEGVVAPEVVVAIAPLRRRRRANGDGI